VHSFYPHVLDAAMEAVFGEDNQVQELVALSSNVFGQNIHGWKEFFQLVKKFTNNELNIDQCKREMLTELSEILSYFYEKISKASANPLSLCSVIPSIKDVESLFVKTSLTLTTFHENLRNKLPTTTNHLLDATSPSFEGMFVVATALNPEHSHSLNTVQLDYAKKYLLDRYSTDKNVKCLQEYFQLTNNSCSSDENHVSSWSNDESKTTFEKICDDFDNSRGSFTVNYVVDLLRKYYKKESEFNWSSFERSVIMLYNLNI